MSEWNPDHTHLLRIVLPDGRWLRIAFNPELVQIRARGPDIEGEIENLPLPSVTDINDGKVEEPVILLHPMDKSDDNGHVVDSEFVN
jgi:hypothetical protein